MSAVLDTETPDGVTREMQAEMDRCGITRYPVYHFRYGPYTYSNLRDAFAQAERDRAKGQAFEV